MLSKLGYTRVTVVDHGETVTVADGRMTVTAFEGTLLSTTCTPAIIDAKHWLGTPGRCSAAYNLCLLGMFTLHSAARASDGGRPAGELASRS